MRCRHARASPAVSRTGVYDDSSSLLERTILLRLRGGLLGGRRSDGGVVAGVLGLFAGFLNLFLLGYGAPVRGYVTGRGGTEDPLVVGFVDGRGVALHLHPSVVEAAYYLFALQVQFPGYLVYALTHPTPYPLPCPRTPPPGSLALCLSSSRLASRPAWRSGPQIRWPARAGRPAR